jgi:NAD(P)-dependent dehydrogenase (short-subunit alcohol dehydrogenase family)
LVTGSSRGIGRAIAEALAVEGADIVVDHYQDGAQAAKVVDAIRDKGCRALAIDADVGVWGEVERLVKEAVEFLGGLDILVNNAGICPFSPFLEVSQATWDRTLSVNLSGPFRLCQLSAREMIGQGKGGRIVLTTSIGAIRPNATQAHYCSTKAGLENLGRGMAIELAAYGITVNFLAPGAILTDINREFYSSPENVKASLARLPIKRLGEPRDCAGAAVFFCLPESAYITGATILVDGGWNCQL